MQQTLNGLETCGMISIALVGVAMLMGVLWVILSLVDICRLIKNMAKKQGVHVWD